MLAHVFFILQPTKHYGTPKNLFAYSAANGEFTTLPNAKISRLRSYAYIEVVLLKTFYSEKKNKEKFPVLKIGIGEATIADKTLDTVLFFRAKLALCVFIPPAPSSMLVCIFVGLDLIMRQNVTTTTQH